jgi:hypothetical protein
MARSGACSKWPAAGLGMLFAMPFPGLASTQPASRPAPVDLCRSAIAAAETAERLPPGLLLAIGLVESGRRHPASGTVSPWPWTINVEGTGRYFETREEAVAAVDALRAGGVRLIDVGCMQVNLHHHPAAFASTGDAFDPSRNALYAARFLKRLHDAAGNWMTAVGRYHSATPGRGEPYGARVAAALPEGRRAAAVDTRRERLVEAWARTQAANRQLASSTAGVPARPAAFQSPVDRMAAAWSAMQPAGASGRPPAGSASNGLTPETWRRPTEAVARPRIGPRRSGSEARGIGQRTRVPQHRLLEVASDIPDAAMPMVQARR